ncbi:hypothetical protein WCQ02_03545 [Paraburkholderia tropica]|uniref:hypothetical protein n=1 Tax=Paraburkholderia tropica TaxID=92647 RepID=UPI003016C637
MKERPILFNGPMVRATLDGSKTQTRRVLKVQPDMSVLKPEYQDPSLWEFRKRFMMYADDWSGYEHAMYRKTESGADLPVYQHRSPFGEPGDRLWVRETWSSDFASHYPFERVWYAADDARRYEIEVRDGVRGIYSPEGGVHVPFRWHPSIHMPRSASRITLEVTDVRIERLQAISDADAEAEGIDFLRHVPDADETLTPSQLFMCLWDSVATPGADWAPNPWVWVVEFKRVSEAA